MSILPSTTWDHVNQREIDENAVIFVDNGLKNLPLAPLRVASFPDMTRYPDVSIATIFEQNLIDWLA
jgi:hypothetical protein